MYQLHLINGLSCKLTLDIMTKITYPSFPYDVEMMPVSVIQDRHSGNASLIFSHDPKGQWSCSMVYNQFRIALN